MTRVRLSIRTLALKGFTAAQQREVTRALKAELERSLSRPGAACRLAQKGAVARLQLGSLALRPMELAGRMGIRAARKIAKGLGA